MDLSLTTILEKLGETLPMLPAVLVILIFGVAGRVARRILIERPGSATNANFRLQLIHLALGLVGVLTFMVVLPVDAALRGQLIGLYGIVLSAAIALASTTFVGNVMAGMMLKAVRNFRTGDYIRVEEYYGRVSDRGLLSTEIQTETRDLLTVPNLFLVTHPVKVIRASGTIITAKVSLGYDVPRQRIEELLLQAAASVELEDPFVQVMELGDFSILYRVAGLHTDTSKLITARSSLRAAVLDALHEGGVEIVSPNFMNQRVLAEDKVFMPPLHDKPGAEVLENEGASPDDLAFDKANEAENIEMMAREYTKTEEEITAAEGKLKQADTDEEKERIKGRKGFLERRLERLKKAREQMIESAQQEEES